jgi:hypothetical protein
VHISPDRRFSPHIHRMYALAFRTSLTAQVN